MKTKITTSAQNGDVTISISLPQVSLLSFQGPNLEARAAKAQLSVFNVAEALEAVKRKVLSRYPRKSGAESARREQNFFLR